LSDTVRMTRDEEFELVTNKWLLNQHILKLVKEQRALLPDLLAMQKSNGFITTQSVEAASGMRRQPVGAEVRDLLEETQSHRWLTEEKRLFERTAQEWRKEAGQVSPPRVIKCDAKTLLDRGFEKT